MSSGLGARPPRLVFVEAGGDSYSVLHEAGVVGRSPQAHLHLPHPSVSWEHAEFRVVDGVLRIRDNCSKNGTWVGPRRLSPEEWADLPRGSVIRIGAVEFHLGPAPPAR